MGKMTRASNPLPGEEALDVIVETDVADSESIPMSQYSMMRFRRLSGDVATLTWYESESENGPWVPSYLDGEAQTSDTGDFANNLPLGLCGTPFLRAVGDDAGVIRIVCRKG